jgi:hypothetical protein
LTVTVRRFGARWNTGKSGDGGAAINVHLLF